MIQLWEVLGRTCVEDGYVNNLLGAGNEVIVSPRAQHDQAFQTRAQNVGMPYLSRAELTEMFRLLKSRVFLQFAAALGTIVRRHLQAAAVPAPSQQLLQILGLSTIDTTFRSDVSANTGDLNAKYRFPLAGPELTAFANVLQDAEADHTYHILHLHWSPPDCICGLSFSEPYQHPLEGGTRDVPPGLDAPQAVLDALNPGAAHHGVMGSRPGKVVWRITAEISRST
jgi:hypothetical protein